MCKDIYKGYESLLDLSVLWQDSGSNSCDCVLELHPGGQYRKGNGCEGLLQLTV